MLTLPTTDDARRLRGFLTDANYCHKQLHETPEIRDLAARLGNNAELLARTAEPTVMNLLLRWFLLGMPQPASAAEGLVPKDVLRILQECGLLREQAAGLTPTAMLSPCDDYYFAADLSTRVNTPEAADTVLWPNPTTRLLQLFSVRKPSRATLDLGAGCGILGILAAPFSEHVTATDLNPRAGEFTLFNARLNELEPVEFLTGDTFVPVEDRRFDLILANPPFFVTPTSDKLYCENEMELDQYCRRVVREAPRHLNEGGYFQAVLEWVQVNGQTWQDRLSEWLDGNGCDAWVLRSYVRDAAGYARERIDKTLPSDIYAKRFDAWMEYYQERGVEEIQGGVLAMRRRSGDNWRRLDGTSVEAVSPFGDLVVDTFATEDILHEQPDDESLLATFPRLPAGVELEQTFRMDGSKWAHASMQIRLKGSAPAESAVEREVAGFLGRCDGTRTLRQLAGELAAKVGVAEEAARRQCCKVVRTLASRRILHLSRG